MDKGRSAPSRKAPNRMPPASHTPRKREPTASARIRRDLRDDIVSLRTMPGEAIQEKVVAEKYGVSRTPVREAVLKLAEDGLVDIFPQAGTFVARIPFHALPEIMVIRSALEETSAKLAATHGVPEDFAALDECMGALSEAAERGDREDFHQQDERFHALIAEAAGYPGLWRLTRKVKVQVDRFRRLTLPEQGRLERVIAEHRLILDAIQRREPDVAARHMANHLGQLQADLAGIASLNPDQFDMTPPAPRPSAAPPSPSRRT